MKANVAALRLATVPADSSTAVGHWWNEANESPQLQVRTCAAAGDERGPTPHAWALTRGADTLRSRRRGRTTFTTACPPRTDLSL